MGDNSFTQPMKKVGYRSETAWCQFDTNNTSAPDGFVSEGVLSVSRTGAGVFRLTMPFSARYYVPTVTLGGAAAAQLGTPTVRAISVSGKTIDLAIVYVDGTPADIDTTDVRVYVTVMVVYG